MAESFELDFLKQALELGSLQRIPYIVEEHFDGDLSYQLPVAYVMTRWFQNEKNAMIKKIAQTPFSKFEEILRDTITTDAYSHVQAMTALMIASHLVDEEQIEAMKASNALINPEEFSLDYMINLFKLRHSKWVQIVEENPTIEQDLTLADPSKFSAEQELYHNNSSSDEEKSEHSDAGHDEASQTPDYNPNRLFQPSASNHSKKADPAPFFGL